jgi:hypothetical protein
VGFLIDVKGGKRGNPRAQEKEGGDKENEDDGRKKESGGKKEGGATGARKKHIRPARPG